MEDPLSFGVKEIFHSMITMSSSVSGNVRTWSMCGGFVPSVNVVMRIEFKKAGVETERTWSTEATIVAERTGS